MRCPESPSLAVVRLVGLNLVDDARLPVPKAPHCHASEYRRAKHVIAYDGCLLESGKGIIVEKRSPTSAVTATTAALALLRIVFLSWSG